MLQNIRKTINAVNLYDNFLIGASGVLLSPKALMLACLQRTSLTNLYYGKLPSAQRLLHQIFKSQELYMKLQLLQGKSFRCRSWSHLWLGIQLATGVNSFHDYLGQNVALTHSDTSCSTLAWAVFNYTLYRQYNWIWSHRKNRRKQSRNSPAKPEVQTQLVQAAGFVTRGYYHW